MKKKLLFAGATLLLAAAAVKSNVSDLLDANVEALARNEDPMCSFAIVKIDEEKHKIHCEGTGKQCCRMNG